MFSRPRAAALAPGHLALIADYDISLAPSAAAGKRGDRKMRQTQLERAKRALVRDGQRLNAYRWHMDDDQQSRHNLQILTAVFYASLDYVWELQTRCGR
jgi:hypothetical protein